MNAKPTALEALLNQIRSCRICAGSLPLSPRPVFRLGSDARLLIVGQAPGIRAHETETPWNDPSGDRLRSWLNMSREVFYDTDRIAIVPAGLCYPGKGGRGDLPPRPECAPLWHPRIRASIPRLRLTLLVGQYAQAYYLGTRRGASLAETVRDYSRYLPEFFPLPHPSPRNQLWFRKHSWLEREVLPALREAVWRVLGGGS